MIRGSRRSTLFPYTALFRSIPEARAPHAAGVRIPPPRRCASRSEEHTSELQSHSDLVCRLLLEKKKAHGEGASRAPFFTLRYTNGNAAAPSGWRIFTRCRVFFF